MRHEIGALVRLGARPYVCAMRALLILLAVPLLAAAAPSHKPAAATPPARPAGPKAIGHFDDWTAATNSEAGQTVCYAAGRSAFARDGHAVASAFGRGKQVTARSPGPRNTTVVDQFSLRGFGRAYEAINKACPPK